MERKPHRYAAVVKAWADGAPIQCRMQRGDGTWREWIDVTSSALPDEYYYEYRVKPEPKPDVVMYGQIDNIRMFNHHPRVQSPGGFCQVLWSLGKGGQDNIKATFDGETGELKKAEVI